ncbi:MAG: glycosyl transferase [Chlorobiaceae bacterium]|nr:glycosyl transferase [Chlorobiaceae bacterium]MBA4309306.1 glycosyl transferase [Chlorobiaceae bacterium]
MDLSIIIVNYNVKEFLQNLLHSINKSITNYRYEIIVVDNNSVDGSVELLREKFPDVKLIDSKTNLGFSKANNLGLKIAKGKFFLLINPDTIVQEDTFEKMINFFQSNQNVGMAGCKILNPDGTFQLSCRRSFPGPWTSFCKVTGLSALFPKSKLFAKYNLTYLDEDLTYEVDALSGSFMMLRKNVYEKIGGLDETFFMYGEDLDWCYRIQKAGFKVFYFHETQIIHYKGESTRRSSIDETRIFYNAMHLFVKKHFSSSFLVVLLLRIAISFREVIAFLGINKLIISAIIIDFFIFNFALFVAEEFYMLLTDWRGFPHATLHIVYTVPAIVHIITAAVLGVYRRDSLSVLRNFWGVVAGFFVVSSLTYFFKEFAFSRVVVVLTYLNLVFLASFWRIFFKLIFKIGVVSTESKKINSVVVGVGENGIKIANKLSKKSTSYNNVIGLISPSMKDVGKKIEEFEIIGSYENISKIIREKKIDEVIFSSDEISYTQIMIIVSSCQKINVEFKMVGTNLDFIVGKSSVNLLDDLPLIEITYNISQPAHKIIKRFFDIVFSFFSIIIFSPFFIFTKRKPNEIYFPNLIWDLPKIFIGKMSFVGPMITDKSNKLYLGKRGATGLWFAENEGIEKNNKLDIFYAKNQNIWLDLEIIGKTLSKFIFNKR